MPSHSQRDCIIVITKTVSSRFSRLVLHMLEHLVSTVKMWFPKRGAESWRKLRGLKADKGNSGRKKLYCNPILTDIPVSPQSGCWPSWSGLSVEVQSIVCFPFVLLLFITQLCKLSTNPRFTFSFLSVSITYTHTHIQNPSVTTAKFMHRLQANINTNSYPDRSSSLEVWSELDRVVWSAVINWRIKSTATLHCRVEYWHSVCGIIFMAFGSSVRRWEERREGLDGILVTCSCYWLHFVALCSSSRQRQTGEKKIKEGTGTRGWKDRNAKDH